VISITNEGRVSLQDLDRRLARAQDNFLKALSTDERAQLVTLLQRLLGVDQG